MHHCFGNRKDVTSYAVSRKEPNDSSKDRVGTRDLPGTVEREIQNGRPVKMDFTVDGSLGMFMRREPHKIEAELPTISLFNSDLNVVLESSLAKPRVEPTANRSTKASLNIKR